MWVAIRKLQLILRFYWELGRLFLTQWGCCLYRRSRLYGWGLVPQTVKLTSSWPKGISNRSQFWEGEGAKEGGAVDFSQGVFFQ